MYGGGLRRKGAYLHGGAVYSSGPVTLRRTALSDNTSALGAGGAVFSSADVHLTGGRWVSGNRAGQNPGGEVIRSEGHVMVEDSQFQFNRSRSAGGTLSSGGGLVLRDSLIDTSWADGSGGAISVRGPEIEIVDSSIVSGVANTASAVESSAESSLLIRSTVSWHKSTVAGGALNGNWIVRDSQVRFNHATTRRPSSETG